MVVKSWWIFVVLLSTIVAFAFAQETDDVDVNVWDKQYPTIVICILVRNKNHTLPYFLGYLEELDYPKNRLKLFIRVDHSSDDSGRTLRTWLNHVIEYYHDVNYLDEPMDDGISPSEYADENGPYHWTSDRHMQILRLKQQALDYARTSWADYVFYLDCDVFLTYSRVLQSLIKARRVAVVPLLKSIDNDYSSFWTTVDDAGQFVKDDQLFDSFYKREDGGGVWPVAVGHSAVLLDLRSRQSEKFTFDPKQLALPQQPFNGTWTDLHVLVRSLADNEARFYLINERVYGWILAPMQSGLTNLNYDVDNMRYLALEFLYDGPPGLLYSPFVEPAYPIPTKFGFDEIYLINLRRRSDRLDRMLACFKILGINARIYEAIDGASLSDDVLQSMQIKQLPEYKDPYHKRTITRGEIGCFLSHYNIWKEVVEKKYEKIVIFEDDLRFVRYFLYMFTYLFKDIEKYRLKWDLIYLGRKRLKTGEDGPLLEDVRYLSHVGYSYWTLAYALTNNGAKKLLDAEPLKRLVPVDEYLPIMFDRHPEVVWKSYFPVRDLIAFTAEPLFVFPVRYTGESGYISDTENTTTLAFHDDVIATVRSGGGVVGPDVEKSAHRNNDEL